VKDGRGRTRVLCERHQKEFLGVAS
jgi:hypothetical protein